MGCEEMRRRLLEVYILRQLNIKHWSKVYFELYFLLFKVLKDSLLSLKRMSTWLWFWNQKISVVIKLSANYCIFSSVIFFRMGKTLFQVLLLKILTDNGHTKIPLSWYAKKKSPKKAFCLHGGAVVVLLCRQIQENPDFLHQPSTNPALL